MREAGSMGVAVKAESPRLTLRRQCAAQVCGSIEKLECLLHVYYIELPAVAPAMERMQLQQPRD